MAKGDSDEVRKARERLARIKKETEIRIAEAQFLVIEAVARQTGNSTKTLRQARLNMMKDWKANGAGKH